MPEQIFISYRRNGGDVYAKLICEALKNKGFSVFYDHDSIQGGYFDARILSAIERCDDFVLVLPRGALDRCQNEDDWVRLEIRHALEHNKNIVPVMLPGFTFPNHLPEDIENVSRINGVQFVMEYFDAVMNAMINRLKSQCGTVGSIYREDSNRDRGSAISSGLEFELNDDQNSYSLTGIGTCSDTRIVIPSIYNDKPVNRISIRAFVENDHLVEVVIPGSVESIGNSAFYSCTSLSKVVLQHGIKTIDSFAFKNCSSLTEVSIPGSVESINVNAFAYCPSLSKVILQYGTKAIGVGAFLECSSLTDITIPGSVETIGMSAFGSCSSLSKVVLQSGTKTIGENAFLNCSSLSEITLPESVTLIAPDAFTLCSSNIDIHYKGTVEMWHKIKIDKMCTTRGTHFMVNTKD